MTRQLPIIELPIVKKAKTEVIIMLYVAEWDTIFVFFYDQTRNNLQTIMLMKTSVGLLLSGSRCKRSPWFLTSCVTANVVVFQKLFLSLIITIYYNYYNLFLDAGTNQFSCSLLWKESKWYFRLKTTSLLTEAFWHSKFKLLLEVLLEPTYAALGSIGIKWCQFWCHRKTAT